MSKFPSAPSPAMDLSDELASLISHDRSTQRPTHNIFDISAPQHQQQQDSSYPAPHFNQAPLPTVNSSLRYENDFHPHFTRHTPSPSHPSRSRSRSRPPSSGGPGAPPPGAIGPARTTRSRRNNSISGTSPPAGRPHAIVIPRSRAATVSNGTSGWYIPSHSTPSDFSLPTPDSLNSHHHHPSPPQNPYSPFSLSPPNDSLHLPPVTALHSLHQQQQSYLHHGSPHSLPNIHTNLGPVVSPQDRLPVSPTSPGNPPAENSKPVTAADKQALLANEKRRRRRESHNAVERRRRDNINEKISELATLIPECMLDVGAPNAAGTNPNPANPVPNGGSPNPADDNNSLDWKKDPAATSPVPSNGTPPPPPSAATGEGAGGPGSIVKANKGMILRKSVEYIRYLQQLVEAQGARNRELEAELKVWRGGDSSTNGTGASTQANGNDGMEMGWQHGAAYTNGHSHGYYGPLPSMPENLNEAEEEDEGVGEGSAGSVVSVEEEHTEGLMEVEDEGLRGRTRGVNGLGAQGSPKKGRKYKEVNVNVKEEGRVEEMMVL
ncbi:hypothetical protein H0H93_006461 [Arthromyces matolae]|nr:hypothetical protein H0H93_006461 [Arthromyces matolae]